MKKKLEGINVLYPTPTIIVDAMVNGKPNFITIAHIVIVNHAKPLLFDMASKKYWSLGGVVANCWNVGKKF